MTASQIRKELHKYVDEVDESFLSDIHAVIQSYIKKNPHNNVGYSAEGKPLTKEQVVKEVLKASKRVKAGQFISQEDLEKEAENW